MELNRQSIECDDEYCEWEKIPKPDGTNEIIFYIDCCGYSRTTDNKSGDTPLDDAFVFCPVCGKPVKELQNTKKSFFSQ